MKAGFWEILLIVILVLILFGHSKIPDLMKNLANGINVFKKELKDNKGEDKPVTEKPAVSAPVKKVVAKKAPAKKAPVKKAVAKNKK